MAAGDSVPWVLKQSYRTGKWYIAGRRNMAVTMEGYTLDNRFREVDEDTSVWDRDKEMDRATQMLPQLSKEGRVRLVDGLIKISDSENPGYAWGMLKKGTIVLSDRAARGTLYHESFHFVSQVLMSRAERRRLYKAAALKYGDKSLMDLEELLAEDFRRYTQGIEDTEVKQMNFIQRMFSSIRDVIRGIFGKNIELDQLFSEINRGRYARRKAKLAADTSYRETEFSREMQAIKAKAIADGTFMKAPNGKPTNLNERQWLQVRTKNFINWFGDWINDPNNASRVVDENGEPLVVYHSSPEYNITVFRDTDSTSFIKYPNETIEEAINRYKELGYEISSEQIDNIRKNNYDIFENPLILTKPNAIYASSNRKVSETYITRESYEEGLYLYGEVYPVFLNIRDNNIIEGNSSNWNEIQYKGKTVSTRELESKFRGIKDGVIIKNIFDFGSPIMDTHETNLSDIFIVYNPNQIKSATDNTGEFSTTNDDIRYRRTDSERIRQHHRNKLQYGNLSQEQKDYIKLRNISIEDYNDMSDVEKEVLFHCMV